MFTTKIIKEYTDTNGTVFSVGELVDVAEGYNTFVWVWKDNLLCKIPNECISVSQIINLGFDEDGDICVMIDGDAYSYYKGDMVRLTVGPRVTIPNDNDFWRCLKKAVAEYKEMKND